MHASIQFSGISRYSNPFVRGLKPRKFLAERLRMLKEKVSSSDRRQYNPEWTNKTA